MSEGGSEGGRREGRGGEWSGVEWSEGASAVWQGLVPGAMR